MEIKAQIDTEKSPLSPKENEQLRLMAEGKTTNQIQEIIHRELSTIKTHRRSMMRKLGAFHAIEALAIAVARGIVTYKKNLFVLCLAGSSAFSAVVPSDIYLADLSSPFEPITDRDMRSNRSRPLRPLRVRSVRGTRNKRENEGAVV